MLKGLGLGLVLWVLFARERRPSFPAPQTHPLRLPGRTVFVGDLEMFVREAGPEDGPPIVLVHGWGDPGLMTFRKMIPLLAERHRVIVPDLRNFGKSDRVRTPYELADLADDLAGLIEAMGLGAVPVFGYSLGGMVVQELARRHPTATSKVVLAGTTSDPTAVYGKLRSLAPLGVAIARAGERLNRVLHSERRTRWLVSIGAVDDEHHRWAYFQHTNRDPEMYWEAGAAVARFDSSSWVGGLGIPTLVIINTEDNVVPVDGQYRLASLVAGCRVEEVVATHAAPLTHAERYATAVEAFIQ